jgi:hypothetical protein
MRIDDHQYPRMELFLLDKFRMEALCEVHCSMSGGHNAPPKTYIYHPHTIGKDVLGYCESHQNLPKMSNQEVPFGQTNTTGTAANSGVAKCQNFEDLFGPMLAANKNQKYILCITDAFSKYVMVSAIPNKEAGTVAAKILNQWFCKFRIPVQIHTNGGRNS